jgi:anaerobic magnesium-protoporphyrin IX monomethyl ester cyclase
MRRRKGEENFEIAAAAMACGGGDEQLTEEQMK